MSMRPGMTVMPLASIVRTPAGTVTALAGPTAVMRSPAMRITPFSIGGPP